MSAPDPRCRYCDAPLIWHRARLVTGGIGGWIPVDDPDADGQEALFEPEPVGTVIVDEEAYARLFRDTDAARGWRVTHGGEGPFVRHDCEEGRRARREEAIGS